MIRTLLVDDEQPARDRLRKMLSELDGVEVIDEAQDGEEAIEKIARHAPDLVFLDIQMPGCSGIEVAASLPSPRPRIIFCTAYDEYAVDAFELHAVDYLLKPVNRARLRPALERVRQSDDESLERASQAAGRFPTRFLAKRSTRFHVIPEGDVICFGSDGGQTKLQTGETHYWMQPTLGDLEKRLDPRRFFRISRAAIVNLDAVREVAPVVGGYGEVRLSNDTRLEITRRRFKPLMDRLSE